MTNRESMDQDAPRIKHLTFKQHAAKRGMWKGSRELAEKITWVFKRDQEFGDPGFVQEKIEISEALLKTIDEILVNAIDQVARAIGYTKDRGGPVSWIKIYFDIKTGEITISNDGQGFPVHQMDDDPNDPKQKDRWSVEAAITQEYTGSNFEDQKDPDRVTGGINGVGLKVVIIDCIEFTVETVDAIRKKYYKQTCRDHMDIIEPPVVVDLSTKNIAANKLTAGQKAPHTMIRFTPDYARLCQHNKQENPTWFSTPGNAELVERCILLRVYQTAAFLSCNNYRYDANRRIEHKTKPKVYYNDDLINIKNINSFAQMFGVKESVMVELESPDDKIRFPWYIAIAPSRGTVNKSGGTVFKFEQISILNGIYLEKGGSHTTMLLTKLYNGLEEHLKAMLAESKAELTDAMKTTLKNLIFMVDCRYMPIPDLVGQTKESVKVGAKAMAEMRKTYEFPKEFIDKVWKMLKPRFEYLQNAKDHQNMLSKKKVVIRKYEAASSKLAKDFLKRWCFGSEGDSASKMLFDILAHKDTPIIRAHCGVYNIQGVPPNALKRIRTVEINGEEKYIQDYDLQNNIALQGLVAALKLEYDCDYFYQGNYPSSDPSGFSEEDRARRAKGDADFKRLMYSRFIISTDQDLDGIGQICSLVVVFIALFWPELIKRGFLWRLATPIIRVYLPGRSREVKNFYSDREFQEWVVANYKHVDNLPKGTEVKYYKGLAGHTKEEVIKDIGINILENMYCFTWDETTRMRMEVMYGKATLERKQVLLNPVTRDYQDALMEKLIVPCSDHFDIEAKTFQVDFMRRKLKCYIDNLIPSQRKAFAGARIMFNKTKNAKVYQVTGYIAKKMCYQHGDASMNETIIKMAQTFTGSNNIPPFMPISNGFGDRRMGRGESGQPRYIDTRYNARVMNIMFPREDDWLLEYVYEENEQCEPKYYVPIVPYSILETSTTTGAGWKIDVWARDFKWVMYNLRQMIKFDYPNPAGKPYPMYGKPWLRPGMSVITTKLGGGRVTTEVCLGSYTWLPEKREIHISQLPLKVWSHPFKCALLGVHPESGKTEDKEGHPLPSKELVEDCIDNTGNDQTDIIVKLVEGGYEKIMEGYGTPGGLTPIEDYLGMYQHMMPHLNMITEEGTIHEFKTYEEVMERWYPIRRDLYKERINRQLILVRLEIMYLENMLRFIKMDATKEINIDKDFDEKQRYQILKGASPPFVEFNKTILLNPKYTKVDQLEKMILDPEWGASYEYIDDIKIGMKSKKAIAKMEAELQALRDKLAALLETTWQSLWLSELDALEKVVEEGIKSDWLFGEQQHEFTRGKARGKKQGKKQKAPPSAEQD